MAEYVQQNLEGMLPELEEMERMGVFSRDEIRLIIRKRRDFEYRLQKRIVQKTDFLRYMQYEINLDMLKKKRKMKLGIKRNMHGEYAVMKKIHNLFQNALKKFVGDIKLWIQYIEFCKHMKSTRVLGKVFARVLQFHPNNPNLWIMAAKWEFEDNRNIPNSRSLLQRGLRMNPTSQQLWLEYFRMELLHLEKIKKRRQILKNSAEEDQIEESVTDEFLAGKVPEIVYQKAIECIPDDVKFRLSFIQIYRLFDSTKEGSDKVYESMIKDFPTSEEVWNAIACRSVDEMKAEARKSGTAISDNRWCELESEMNKQFDKAVATVPTDKMWEFYIMANMKLLNDSTQVQAKRRVQHVLQLFSLADGSSLLTEELYNTWVNFLLQIEEPKQALSVCEKGVKLFKKSVTLWSEYLRLQVLNQGALEEVHNDFSSALKCVDAKESLGLWNQWLEWCITCNKQAIDSVFELSFSSSPEVNLSMKEKYLDWTLTTSGIKRARKLYKRLILLRPTSVSLFRKCIDLELNQVSPGINRARDLYECAIGHFGASHPDLWLDLIRLELDHPRGNPKAAGHLYWRAMKRLRGDLAAEFVTHFSLLQAGRVG